MPIDPRIPLGTTVAQLPSPIETMTALGQLQAQREATQARRLASEEAREKKNRQARLDLALKNAVTIGPDGRPTVDFVKLFPNVDPETLFNVQKIADESATRLAQMTSANLGADKLVKEYLAGLGRQMAEFKYRPDAYALAVTAAVKAHAMTQDQADGLIQEAMIDPTAIERRSRAAIAAVTEPAKPAPPQLVTHVPTTGPMAGQTVQEFLPPVAGPQYAAAPKAAGAAANLQQKEVLLDGQRALVNYNPDTGQSFQPTPAGPVDVSTRVRPIPSTVDPTLSAIRDLQLSALQQGRSPAEVAIFNQIVSQYQRSPLVAAADRTIVLQGAIEQIRKDPGNAPNQMLLSYAFIQAADTYMSAVREGEQANITALSTRLQQLQVEANRIYSTGAFMPPDLAQQIADTGEQLVKIITAGAKRKQQEFSARALASGVDDIWNKFMAAAPGFPAEPAPRTGGGGTPTNDPLGIR